MSDLISVKYSLHYIWTKCEEINISFTSWLVNLCIRTISDTDVGISEHRPRRSHAGPQFGHLSLKCTFVIHVVPITKLHVDAGGQ